MKLHTCGMKDAGGSMGHPCGRAILALRKAGHEFELVVEPGYRIMPWSRWGKREHIHALSGQRHLPVLETGAGEVIAGSGKIVAWARSHPA